MSLNYSTQFVQKYLFSYNYHQRNNFQLLDGVQQTNKMDDDMRRALLSKKTGAFDKPYEECLLKIQKIKQKNDFMQKQVGTDSQDTVKRQLVKQRQFIQKQINDLKALMEDMDKKFRDPEAKNKLKNLKVDAQKQIERNKRIMQEFINKSFLIMSRESNDLDEDADQYMQKNSKAQAKNVRRRDNQDEFKSGQGKSKQNSLITDDQVGLDFEIERKMLHEKKELLNQVQQATNRINTIMNDMAIMVDEQGEHLDVISEEMMRANKNLVQANTELDQASTQQKKARRKYLICAGLMIILILGVVGVVFFAV